MVMIDRLLLGSTTTPQTNNWAVIYPKCLVIRLARAVQETHNHVVACASILKDPDYYC